MPVIANPGVQHQESSSYASEMDSRAGVRMKQLLLIAFDFPPRRTSGVYRPTAFTKFLPSYGWQPTVLTIRPPSHAVFDQTLIKRIPENVVVKRTRYLPLDWWESSLLKAVRSAGALQPQAVSPSDDKMVSAPRASTINACLRSVAKLVRDCLYFPDETAGWIPFGLLSALELNLKHHFDVVYTTHPPRAAHPIGLMLKMICNIPWIMEFRDPWIVPAGDRPITEDQVPAPRRNAWLHRQMLDRCDGVVTVTHRHAHELQESFGVNGGKVSVIRNGFDEDDFYGIQADGQGLFDPKFVNLAQFGTVYPGFSGKFFHAAAELIQQHPELKDRVRIHIIGYPDTEIELMAAQSPLKEVVVIHGFLEHAKVLRLMFAADALLLFYGHEYTSRASVPGKLYEYLRVGRPILATAYPGGVQDLIEEANAGWVLKPDDISGLKAALAQVISQRAEGRDPVTPNKEVVSRFRYDRLSQELSLVLNRVVNA